jgi:Cu/Ag efflux pump CusA
MRKMPELPQGYSIDWTASTEASRARLRVIVPLTLVIIVGLLVVAIRFRWRELFSLRLVASTSSKKN